MALNTLVDSFLTQSVKVCDWKWLTQFAVLSQFVVDYFFGNVDYFTERFVLGHQTFLATAADALQQQAIPL